MTACSLVPIAIEVIKGCDTVVTDPIQQYVSDQSRDFPDLHGSVSMDVGL